jgi:hypothetical protein
MACLLVAATIGCEPARPTGSAASAAPREASTAAASGSAPAASANASASPQPATTSVASEEDCELVGRFVAEAPVDVLLPAGPEALATQVAMLERLRGRWQDVRRKIGPSPVRERGDAYDETLRERLDLLGKVSWTPPPDAPPPPRYAVVGPRVYPTAVAQQLRDNGATANQRRLAVGIECLDRPR